MIGAQADTVAPPSQHAIPFYDSSTGAEERGYLELRGASHFAPNTPNTTIAKYTIAWLKRFVDDDTATRSSSARRRAPAWAAACRTPGSAARWADPPIA